ncbi:MAG TPA: hypothetical protein VG013_09270 [Gemmataceae bacterium]|jgi:lipid-A-disaccharide synthase|nr:hypothetical protein [Gemmataceae bacterium]
MLFVSTGSTSSDILLAPVLVELRRRGKLGEVVGIGGTPLGEVGVHTLFDSTSLSSLGHVASYRALLANGPNVLAAYRSVKNYFRKSRPALVILVDNPGQNMPVLGLARRHGIRVLYYVPPERWMISRLTVRAIAAKATTIATIFRSEYESYRNSGGNTCWVGHPMIDLLEAVPRPPAFTGRNPTVGLFPGSRRLEVQELLPVLRGAAEIILRAEPTTRFVMCSANEMAAQQIAAHINTWKVPVEVVHRQSMAVLSRCDLLLACAGTATLEAAILGVPMVTMYRLRYWLDRVIQACAHLNKYSFFSLPNYVLNRAVVPELRSRDANPHTVAAEGLALLRDPSRREAVAAGLAEVRQLLGPPGALGRVADLVSDMLGTPSGQWSVVSG